ncbi:MAG: ABC transporter ATP-binding protein [Clostridiales bacterium]|nr:ABC transporter ATP-binding protein [Clostridiales bacterium]
MEIRFIGVGKVYPSPRGPVEALAPITLDVESGSFTTLLGPSGCGKSTLLRLAAGLEEPSFGEVWAGGKKVVGPGAERGLVPQAYSLLPWRTVEENIQLGWELRGMPPKERKARAREFLRIIGLEAFADRYPKELSGGMKQRVAIARALANDPAVLLMDEPFAALDAQTRMAMQEEVLRIWEGTRKTILFVTHDIEEALFLSDRVVVMTPRPGRIKGVWDVPFPRPRPWDLRFEKSFVSLREHLMEEIRQERKEGLA